MLCSFFQQLYNTVDAIIVGRALGTEALASVGASSPILNQVNGFFLGIASGATVILSQAYGAGDRDRVNKTLHTAMALALTLGVVITVVGILMAPQVLTLIGTPENCMEDAVTYCRIYFGGVAASMVYNMGAGILRAMGDSRRPMFFLLVCCLVNIVGDLLFIYVFQMGIAGALGVSVTTFVGQNFGAQKYDRVRRSVWVCMGLGVAMVGTLNILEFTFREFLLGIFTTDFEVIRIGAEMMMYIVLWNTIFIPIEVLAGTMRGTGYALPPTVIMCVCVCLFRILWILLAVERWHTIFALCLAYPISWVLCVLTFAVFYLKGTWLHGRIKALGMPPAIH